ncbi:MAG: DNA polymerase IV [Methylomonas sp.]|nr:DNA polymerase IV [Methylomonas sp.]PPD22924.1 MAG: DNA polymerase IV [Methylomonas sp.]PPD26468.1 MAG: DNA polymerase IV [Methylomonas sp.]PPD38236.1 MAG: DNA polymerase IV [Methylomonas sp.]PPD41953.1 MAG: DNA polymerase IV [Methylomonas sp.]
MHDTPRKIIHIDMDAFYAAVEQRDHPQYRNKPVIVGGKPDSRGVVATCSYEARAFGVHSAMPSSQAYRLCPQAIFVKPRFDAYRQASQAIRDIFGRYCDGFEPLSLDEAYLDVSNNPWFHGSASLLARQIKQDIRRETGLTASAGVSYNKFLAKIASDLGKPDGLYIITPDQANTLIASLPIRRFHGIGPATERKMRELGIETGADLREWSLARLQAPFGKNAAYYHDIARGIDHRIVNHHRPRKSVGVETTFEHDITAVADIVHHLRLLLDQALLRLNDKRMTAHALTIKIKYRNFVQVTRGRTLPSPITDATRLHPLLAELLKNTEAGHLPVRLLGVTLSALNNDIRPPWRQLDLFQD